MSETPYRLFKGTLTEYRLLHRWVQKQLGKPKQCENCGITKAKRFGWANISGQYNQDISDWARLCTRCHGLIDDWAMLKPRLGKTCRRGHEITDKDIYTRPSGSRTCRICIRLKARGASV